MSEDAQEKSSKVKPKTRATKQAVFDYCNELKSRGFKGDYCQAVTTHFNAGNSTVTPHIQAWRASLPTGGDWPMDEGTQAAAHGFVSQIWEAACQLAQHKLVVETMELKTKLRNAEELVAQYSSSHDVLTEKLALEQEKTEAQANDAYATAADLAETQDELKESKKLLLAYDALKVDHEALQNQLRETELKLSKLEGKYEAMMEKRGEA